MMRFFLGIIVFCAVHISYGMEERHPEQTPGQPKGWYVGWCGICSSPSRTERRPLLNNGHIQANAVGDVSLCQTCRDHHGGKIVGAGCLLCIACSVGVGLSFAGCDNVGDASDLIGTCKEWLESRQ